MAVNRKVASSIPGSSYLLSAWLTPPSVFECVHEWVNVRQYCKALWVATKKSIYHPFTNKMYIFLVMFLVPWDSLPPFEKHFKLALHLMQCSGVKGECGVVRCSQRSK